MSCPNCNSSQECPFKNASLNPNPASPHTLDGILNINKPGKISSHGVVNAVRKFSHLKRIGHAGTLDPMATGVMLVGINQGVRVTEFLIDHDKKYRARVHLGIETDSFDATGTITAQHDVNVTREQIENALASLVGKQAQMPPAFSAIKRNGVPHYKLARQGKEVELEARDVEIYSIELREVALPEVEFDVYCSKGTYIRSLAHDLGEKLGCGAHLSALTRTASGNFSIDDSHTLDEIRDAFEGGYIERYLHPLDEGLLQFEAIILDAGTAKRVEQGIPLTCGRDFATPLIRAYSTDGGIVALLERGHVANSWKPKKVFRNE
jgi:tRNA pseudouridine55 synthase